MATLTFTDTADFVALNDCSINDAVLPGFFNFATDDTGTGLDDFTQNPSTGSISLSGEQLSMTPTNTTNVITAGNMANITHVKADVVDGSGFDAYVTLPSVSLSGSDTTVSSQLMYVIDNSNYIYVIFYISSGNLRADLQGVVDGSFTINQSSTGTFTDSGGVRKIRLTRSGDTFTARISTDNGATWSAGVSAVQAYGTTGQLALSVNKQSAITANTFDDLKILSGVSGTAQALIGDTGTGTGRHIDAGSGNKFDWSTFAPTLSGASATWDVEADNVGSFDNTTYTHTGLTTAQVQALSDTGRYAQIRANLTATGASPTLSAVSIDTIASDVTPPTDASATNSRITGTGDSTRVVVAWTNGSDNVGGIGFKGSTVELEVSSVWNIFKSDGSWAETASTASSLYEYIGTAGSKEGVLVDSEEGPTGFAGATRARITGYDDAGNTNDLILTIVSDDFPAVGDVQAGVDYDNGNYTGTLALPTEAQVESGVGFGAGGTEFTGTFAGGTDSPDAPAITSVAAGDGQVTLTVTLNAAGDDAYVIYAVDADGQAWSAPSDTYKLTASGSIVITGLDNLMPYRFAVVSKTGTVYSLPTRVVAATPRSSAQASGFQIRDAEATASLVNARVLGCEIQFRNNPDDEFVSIWAIPGRGSMGLQLRRTAPTDSEELQFTIPRQTNFPPASFANGATIRYQSADYEIDDVTPSRGHPVLSGSFDVTCSRYRSESEVS